MPTVKTHPVNPKIPIVQPDDVPVIRAHYDTNKEWRMDPKGFFTIKPFPKEGIIRARYYVVDSGKYVLKLLFEGKNAEDIYNTIVREGKVSLLQHAAYLGAELTKAEIAMKLGKEYVQDCPLSLA